MPLLNLCPQSVSNPYPLRNLCTLPHVSTLLCPEIVPIPLPLGDLYPPLPASPHLFPNSVPPSLSSWRTSTLSCLSPALFSGCPPIFLLGTTTNLLVPLPPAQFSDCLPPSPPGEPLPTSSCLSPCSVLSRSTFSRCFLSRSSLRFSSSYFCLDCMLSMASSFWFSKRFCSLAVAISTYSYHTTTITLKTIIKNNINLLIN